MPSQTHKAVLSSTEKTEAKIPASTMPKVRPIVIPIRQPGCARLRPRNRFIMVKCCTFIFRISNYSAPCFRIPQRRWRFAGHFVWVWQVCDANLPHPDKTRASHRRWDKACLQEPHLDKTRVGRRRRRADLSSYSYSCIIDNSAMEKRRQVVQSSYTREPSIALYITLTSIREKRQRQCLLQIR